MEESNRIFGVKEDEQAALQEVAIQQIVANRYQPRTVFEETELDELAQSIKQHGILQPIVLRKVTSDMYEIIAGERRFRAAKKAGLERVQAIVRNVSAVDAAILALIENVQREDLSAIEEAKSYEQLQGLYGGTQQDIAQMVGKSQSAVANKLRLLNLTTEVQEAIENRHITERHGRSLLKIKNAEAQIQILKWILSRKMTVAETENYVERFLENEKLKKSKNNLIFFNIAKDTKLAVNTINKAVKTIQEFGMEVEYEKEETDTEYILKVIVPKHIIEKEKKVRVLPHEAGATTADERQEKRLSDTSTQIFEFDLTSETEILRPDKESQD